VPGWVTIFGRVNHLRVEPGTPAYSIRTCPLWQAGRVPGEIWESKQAHRMIHQPVSVVLQCGAGAWLYGLARGDKRRLTGSGSA